MTQLTARLLAWDTRVLVRLVVQDGHRRRLLLARTLTRSADGPAYALLPLGILLVNGRAAIPFLLVAIAAGLFERALYFGLKPRLRRIRPSDRYADIKAHVRPPDRFSFPSGHTSAAALVAVLLASRLPGLGPFLAVWVAGVGASRVCLGVHYPSDVLAGALIGSAIGWAALAVSGLPLPV